MTRFAHEWKRRHRGRGPSPWRVVVECGEYDANAADATFIAHARADVPYLLDLLAQRDGESEALRGKVARVVSWTHEGAGPVSSDDDALAGYRRAQSFVQRALSDNQESPALTDKEA